MGLTKIAAPCIATLAAAALLALAGCYTITDNPKHPLPPGSPGLMSYVPPLPADYRQRISDRIRTDAKDPYSIRDAAISSPMRRWVGLLYGGEATVVCVRMNAKNSFGAYTGLKAWTFIFDAAGQIAAVTKENSIACGGPAIFYQPFPEVEQGGAAAAPAR